VRGRPWAETTADAHGLQRLEKWKDAIARDLGWEKWLQGIDDGNAFGLGEQMAHAMIGRECGRDNLHKWWMDNLPDHTGRMYESAFIKGFVEGALDVWYEVKEWL
jgi:hypothetical protein